MGLTITIVDYGMGNLSSVKNAFDHIGVQSTVTNKIDDLKNARAICLPGVGAFGEAMTNLKNLNLVDELTYQVVHQKKPFLGICLGMQLIAESSEENGLHKGLGWIDGKVLRIQTDAKLRLPHIGWNDLHFPRQSFLYEGMGPDKNFYFVHSYQMVCDPQWVTASCEYGGLVTASVQKENMVATQFHPEKSHANGMLVLRNFIKYATSLC
ncbi:MAG: imidazole glycerol phosphate synthase, glutamine amidotransferase subunit [Deltaproteobacteria bacterium RIFCSPLOWO2_12_FULL_40_28]|nr:MAG: imidazole glycerol phosphate synthase, glutamine amidotransferase subunit [Deltaproteobacteria bacterium RIFCSPHIGHO2_02_FULL_40_28]OGQ19582.1 MAG: imidazole glycerol phosphate synthase, glutamine amidotransferase subunit [Deltaproteobacteria bacterium RIFCSPHIGHO2_12_FULL_40_32]OGQ40859.1 MAG: imidazole glycerol phosphate synthase, glutamine amidotransferase subunit [Deltaproteobacteria bacterium RIFCSPLOWO2_02_FULL_40_36]OGQ53974.1 MAG: imidazole glycerol phosphate synthase, glutamine 